MEELMVKIEKMDFEKQQLEAEKIELIEKRNALQKESLEAQKELAVAKVTRPDTRHKMRLVRVFP